MSLTGRPRYMIGDGSCYFSPSEVGLSVFLTTYVDMTSKAVILRVFLLNSTAIR